MSLGDIPAETVLAPVEVTTRKEPPA